MKKTITIGLLLLIATACKNEQSPKASSTSELSQSKSGALSINTIVDEGVTGKHSTQNSYAFDWSLTVEAKSDEGVINMYYLVKSNASYYGMTMDPAKGRITIMDFEINKIHTLMDRKGKVVRTRPIPEPDKDDKHYKVTRTDTKTILDYECQGYKIETDESTSIYYVTNNAPFSFSRGFGPNSKSNPKEKGIDPKIMEKLEKGLIMEFTYIGRNSINQSMKVTEIKKEPNTFNLNEYKRIGS